MNDELLASLLSASNSEELNELIAADPVLSNPDRWFMLTLQATNADPIQTLALNIHEALQSVISKKCITAGIDATVISNTPAFIRDTLYPEAAGWTTYASIEDAARAVRLGADGDRFASNLFLSDEGIANHAPVGAPATVSFCGIGSGLLYAFKNDLGYWQIIIYRTPLADGRVSFCQFRTSSTIELSFHPQATRVQKLFQYGLPVGGRSVIAKDLLDQLQQTIHDSIIPFSVRDKAGRYGFDRFLSKASLGLDFKLRRSQKKQLSYLHTTTWNGKTVNIYLFKLRFERQHEQTTRHTLNQLYFKSDRHIVFLSQGMVIGDLGANFIEYSVGFKHLRNHLLVSLAEVPEEEIDYLKTKLAAYLADDEELQRQNRVYDEELTAG